MGKNLSWTGRKGRSMGPGELADVLAKPELGQLQSVGFLFRKEAGAQFQSEIPYSPSLGVSGILLKDKLLALGCCRNPEAPELPCGSHHA